jgi:hypothetical protein
MGLIKVMDNGKQPQSKCPHCKQVILLNLDHWKKDMSKIVESKCPLCGGQLFTALLVLVHGSPHVVAQTIMKMQGVVDEEKRHLLG